MNPNTKEIKIGDKTKKIFEAGKQTHTKGISRCKKVES